MRPALDYFGGKWKMAPRIIEHFPTHKTFVDVMCGAASITIRKPRSKNEIINDVHNELINFFQVLRDRNPELRSRLEKTPYGREEYRSCRELSSDPLEQARRTVVKSWFGIGDSLDNETGFRVSLTQHGTTTGPWLTYVDYLHVYAERLRGVIIESLDYEELCARYDNSETLFYFDPPYVTDLRSTKHAYKHEWNDEDHHRLVRVLKSLKAPWILSGYDTELYDGLDARKVQFSGTSQNGARVETLWLSRTIGEDFF